MSVLYATKKFAKIVANFSILHAIVTIHAVTAAASIKSLNVFAALPNVEERNPQTMQQKKYCLSTQVERVGNPSSFLVASLDIRIPVT